MSPPSEIVAVETHRLRQEIIDKGPNLLTLVYCCPVRSKLVMTKKFLYPIISTLKFEK
jgi:hypothetical protein